jgi:N-acetylglucosaminyldiphosphoundecaprenol N-acetyl-beta-D-mannosaminyltransferase
MRINILGIEVDRITMAEAISVLLESIDRRIPSLIATANAEMIMLAQQDPELMTILNAATLVLPDGAGVVWAAKNLGNSLPERVAGYDLTQELLKKAAGKGYRIFWLGAAHGVAEMAAAKAEELYPGFRTVGIQDGFFAGEDERVIKAIQTVQPDILLCALGVPKQEKWLFHYQTQLQVPVMIGVGGTFDVMAGRMKRAPVWMQNASLEWFFRLLCQPSRFRRMLALPRFVVRVLQSAWTSR